jgi:hypothetical protein
MRINKPKVGFKKGMLFLQCANCGDVSSVPEEVLKRLKDRGGFVELDSCDLGEIKPPGILNRLIPGRKHG